MLSKTDIKEYRKLPRAFRDVGDAEVKIALDKGRSVARADYKASKKKSNTDLFLIKEEEDVLTKKEFEEFAKLPATFREKAESEILAALDNYFYLRAIVVRKIDWYGKTAYLQPEAYDYVNKWIDEESAFTVEERLMLKAIVRRMRAENSEL